MQLLANWPRIRKTLLQTGQNLFVPTRIVISAILVPAPNTITRRLHATRTVFELFTPLRVVQNALRYMGAIQSRTIVDDAFRTVQQRLGNILYVNTFVFLRVPHTLYAEPRAQTGILRRQVSALSRRVPQQIGQHLPIKTPVDEQRAFENNRGMSVSS